MAWACRRVKGVERHNGDGFAHDDGEKSTRPKRPELPIYAVEAGYGHILRV